MTAKYGYGANGGFTRPPGLGDWEDSNVPPILNNRNFYRYTVVPLGLRALPYRRSAEKPGALVVQEVPSY